MLAISWPRGVRKSISRKTAMTMPDQPLESHPEATSDSGPDNRFMVIVNPISGRGNGEKFYPIIEKRLRELGIPI
jgi:hypothetical protein